MIVLILSTVLLTSFISGVLGMAGGTLLMGLLTLIIPVSSAMILHGVTQLASNGFRAYLLREHVRYSILPFYGLGSFVALAVFATFLIIPNKELILITVGLLPLATFFVPKSFEINILKPVNAFACGLTVNLVQILAGVAGPVLDVFFIKSPLNRHEVIATKAVTQSLSHLAKIVYYGKAVFLGATDQIGFTYFLFPLAIGSAFLGTKIGTMTLAKMTDHQFRAYSQWIVGLIGLFYVVVGLLGLYR